MTEYISPEGLERLKRELEEFKTARRREIAERLEAAKALGDLSENAEYQEAKEAQSLNEARIQELEEMLRDVVLIKKPSNARTVQIGATIEVESGRGRETFTIVGSEEADPLAGRISNESPMGRAFLGRSVGDTVDIKTPGGNDAYKVRKIR
ncbi:MAG: transcription elongation factor GreA [Candidatus Sungbacteria bacterium RIFCSPLOWO2_01_FULL_59_16]|uniref:Transcription elongation factor GreA n=1 Tax=Candidatus Sungbacteria bacterium RIFCSPLOWO2_01_FULL_59_16 TaxID=1802280 RepID=A0A1G2LD64_9BACT|nr:MAG: transcription elongation factor GreA [Candidatus Sungbacteria bacterium RIFCSPLOWO2_01_FULL_59_16]